MTPPPQETDTDDDNEAQPAPVTTITPPVINPDTQTYNTSDGPAGGNPEEFEELTGLSSDWEPHESDNEESGGGSVGAEILIGGGLIASRPFWAPITAFFTGLFAAPVVAAAGGIAAATIPGNAGAGRQTHDIDGTEHTIQINADMSVGQVYDANGRPTGIQVSMTGVDDAGNPTGFTPLSEQDAQALGALTGTSISTGSIIDTTLNAESSDETSETDEPGRTSSSIGAIAQETGMTEREVKDAIHDAKRDIPKGTAQRNPDVIVDLDTGEIHPVANDGTVGDSIGNIYD